MVDTTETTAVAVVGVAFEFPQCDDWESLTALLRDGRDVMRQIPDTRVAATDITRSAVERDGGWIDDITGFDHRYFGLSRADAALVDPRQRRMLHLAVRAIGDAGYSPAELAGTDTAVLVADYGGPRASLFDLLELAAQRGPAAETGSLHALLAGRIAYHLDLRGAAEVIDTACSSFLVSLHEARWKLVRGECDVALVGGYELSLGDWTQRSTDVDGLGLLSPAGRCRPFDAAADGFTSGEGGGFVVVKRLAQALRDGDRVRAVIRGSAINQDAARTAGLTAPSPSAQTDVIAAAWRDAGVSAASIGYVEAHGTGTKIGDPLEIQGLAGVLGAQANPSDGPWISSVKGNFGHLGGAAAFAGLIRILAQFRSGEVFPTAGFQRLNPLLGIDGVPLRVADRVEPWPAGEHGRCAALSSFGLSGTNAHLVVAEPSATAPSTPDQNAEHTVLLSARDAAGLSRHARRLRDLVARDPAGFDLTAAAQVLAVGREHFAHRLGWVVSSADELVARLDAAEAPAPPAGGTAPVAVALGDVADVPPHRLRELACSYRGFARVLTQAAEHVPEAGWSPAQRALLSLLGGAAVLADAGVTPALLLSHGLGGLAAQVLRGELTPTAALDAVARQRDAVEPPNEIALRSMTAGGHTIVDLAPGTALSGCLPTAVPLAEALCRWHVDGRSVDWAAVLGRPRRRIELPVAPLSEEHLWPAVATRTATTDAKPVLPQQQRRGAVPDEVLAMARDVLGEPELALTDEFLASGGNSLNGTQLIAAINDRFGVDLDVLDVFDVPDLRGLAAMVAAQTTQRAPTATAAPTSDAGPLSEQQLAVLAALRRDQNPGAHNQPAALLLHGDVDPAELTDRLTCLVRIHPMLRTRLTDTPNGPRQVIGPVETAKVELVRGDLVIKRPCRDGSSELLERLRRLAAVPVSPYDDPPVRYQLIRVGFTDGTRHVLLVTFHRLFIDEWAWHRLFEELLADPAAIPAPRRQYLDYVRDQQRLLADDTGGLTEFWTGYLAGSRYTPPPVAAGTVGAASPLTVDGETTGLLRALAHRERGTLHMLLLACWVALLRETSGEHDIAVAVVAAGRAPEDEYVLGNFANTLLLRVGVRPDASFAELLGAVREMTLLTFAHQHLPTDRIATLARRGAGPLAGSTFTFKGSPVEPSSTLGRGGPPVELIEFPPAATASPVSLTVLETAQELHIDLQCAGEPRDWLADYGTALSRLAAHGGDLPVAGLVGSDLAAAAPGR